MKNIPKAIYLNFGFDKEEVDSDTDFNELSNVLWSTEKINSADVKYVLNPKNEGVKKLEKTVKQAKDGDVEDVYFALTLVVDKQNNLRVYNTKEDGDWKENVDCDTLIVKEIRLRAL